MKTFALITLSGLILIMCLAQILAILDKIWPIWWVLFLGEVIGLLSGGILIRESWTMKVIGSITTISAYCLMAWVFFDRVDILDTHLTVLGLISYLTVHYWLQLLPGRRAQPVH
ncbi:MAG: hypothetical protein WC465_03870 [Patescibacteria group bacterium]